MRTRVSLIIIEVVLLGAGCQSQNAEIWSAEARSPNGDWLATARTIQHFGPGAAGIETRVYLKWTRDSKGPQQILEFFHDGAHTINLAMRWVSPSHLEVTYDGHASLDFQVVKCGGIDVSVRDLSHETINTSQLRQARTGRELWDLNPSPCFAGWGRWLMPDPLGGDLTNPQSLNRYAYVLNSPTTLTDPLGLDGCSGGYPGTLNCTVTVNGGEGGPGGPGSVLWDLIFGSGFGSPPLLIYYPGPFGGGGSGTPPSAKPPQSPFGSKPINRSWPSTFSCNMSPDQLMSAVESDFSNLAD
jgi:hypothetical protein